MAKKDHSVLFAKIRAKWYALTVDSDAARTIYDGEIVQRGDGGFIDCDIWCHAHYGAIAAFPHSVATMTKILEHDPVHVFILSSKDGHIRKVQWRLRGERETVPAATVAQKKCAVQ